MSVEQKQYFSPKLNEVKRRAIQFLAELVRPYKNAESWRHRFVVGLYLGLLRETEYADAALMRELQLIRLRRILKIANTIPWWRKYFTEAGFDPTLISDLRYMERLPPITKHSLADVPKRDVTARFPLGHKRIFLHRTSGTTGAPFEWGVDKNALFVETTSYFYRALKWYGIKRCGIRAFIASFTWQSYGQPSIEMHWSPADKNADTSFFHILNRMRALQLSVFFAYPTNLFLFARRLAETGEKAPFDLIMTTGQRIDDESREYIEKIFGCPVVALYGAREFGQMAIECPKHRHWYHINSERLLLEIADENGKALPDDEEGFITITSLENRIMPLIRYQLGDRGRIISGHCSCGRTLPLLQFFGRELEYIKYPSGKTAPFRQVNPPIFQRFFDDIKFYQVLQPSLHHIVFKLKLKHTNMREFEKRFLPEMKECIGDEHTITVEYCEEWPVVSGRKIKMFVPLR